MKSQKFRWNILAQKKSIEPQTLAKEVLTVRGYKPAQIEEFLNPNYSQHLADPLLLPSIKKAANRLNIAIQKNQKIVIYGDYDIDGITASALLFDFLKACHATVDVYIPDRFEEGYGLNSDAIKKLKKQNVDLVVTVDCGVGAIEQIKLAKKLKLDLIVTDHHEPPAKLPTGAVAIINPKIKTSKYPFSQLAGVGVAFCLVRTMQKQYKSYLEAGQEKWLLDLVALGTVCDVVPLTGENRVLTHYGLQVLSKTRRVGLRALAKVSAVELSKIDEYDLGFRFGPRLNAAGRLQHAKTALRLLLTKDNYEAQKLAEKLNELNYERQQLTQEVFMQADVLAKAQKQNLILVLSSSAWSAGIIGIVASRIAEKWHKPCIMFAVNGDTAKGSARSYGDFSIIEAIAACSADLTQYGGHNFAAGMSIKSDNIELFNYKLNQYALANTDITTLLPSIDIDLSFDNLEPELSTVNSLEELKPFGNDNPQPVFVSKFFLQEYRFIGQNNNHLKFKLKTKNHQYIDGIAFSSAHKWPNLESGQSYFFAYNIQKNTWQNIERLQIEIIDIKQSKE